MEEVPEFIKKPNARAIRTQIDGWYTASWPYRERRAKIEIYANGGPPPQKNPKKDPQVVPLGLAKSAMTKARDALTDTFDQKPGPVYLKYINPSEPTRSSYVESQVNLEFNKIILQYAHEYILAAGTATLSGTCAWYRTSANEIRWRTGDIYFPLDAPVNPQDEEWREWALLSELTISTLEELIKKAKDDDGGWSKSALEQLKLYIMCSEYQQRGNQFQAVWGEFDRTRWLGLSLADYIGNNPISVAWYFKKNGKHTEDKDDPNYYGHEEIDVMCLSRYGAIQPVRTDNSKNRWMETTYTGIKSDEFAEILSQTIIRPEVPDVPDGILLFRKESAFRSIDECLLVHTDDDRVAGHATLLEVRGPGKNMMPRIAVQEGLLGALLEGLTMSARPHWQEMQNGVAVDKIRGIQQGSGLPANSVIPFGIQPAAKNNSFSGFGPGMEMVKVIDGSMAGETSVSVPAFGGQQAEFQAQAEAQLGEASKIALRRFRKWLRSLDRLFNAQAQTLLRPYSEWKSWMPGYWQAMQFHNCLQNKYGITVEELEYERYEVSARRMAGELQDQQVINNAVQFIQAFGQFAPQIIQPLVREACRAKYGDVWVATHFGPLPKDGAPVQAAMGTALASCTVPPLDPTVPATLYLEMGMALSAKLLQIHAGQGEISPTDQWGMICLLQLTKNAAVTLPENIAKPAVEQIDQMALSLRQIPVAPSAAEQEQSIEREKLELQKANLQRLEGQGEFNKQKTLEATLLKRRDQITKEAESRARIDNTNTVTAEAMQRMAMQEMEVQNPEEPPAAA